MSNTKHTPGPWEICEHSWADTGIYTEGGGKRIAGLSIYDEATEKTQSKLEDQMLANAKLIAAAPDLLKALQELHHYTVNHKHLVGFIKFEHLKEQAEEAIKKATE